MAALDRRISILDFVGQSWTSWSDNAGKSTPEGCSPEECSKTVKKRMETMALKKEDMSIYGHCPSHDDFFLVVCSHCDLMVKPQAFEKHCERRHGLFSKLYGLSSKCSPDRPQQEKPPSQHGILCEGQDKCQAPVPTPRFPHPGRSKPQREGHSHQQVDKISHGTPPSPVYFSTPNPEDPHHRSPISPKESPPIQKPLQKSWDSLTSQQGSRTCSRTYKNALQKDCDLDKHCGVMDPERKKVCTRLLTCNIHSIHQRRQVGGRSKAFDQLLTELKMNSKPRKQPPLPKQLHDGSIALSDSALEMVPKVMLSEEMQVESCSDSFYSEESDEENRDIFAHLPLSTSHPKPLGLCTFGARVFGRSILVFDRKLFHLRSAFTVMMEQHLSTSLWKKIPQVSELCSYQPHVNHNSQNFTSCPSHKSSSLRTNISGKSEVQPNNLTTPSKLPTKAQSASGPGRFSNSVGRSSKRSLQATIRELQAGPTASKRPKSQLGDGELPGQGKIMYTQHHMDQEPSLAKTAISSPCGPFSGTPISRTRPLVYATEIKGLIKPKPTLVTSSPPSESDKGGVSGLNHRTLGYQHKGKKRKTSGASLTKNTPCAVQSSILFSFSQTQSSLTSWGVDGRPGSNFHTVPKKLGTQKPKLLH